jgi:hypothetical protein
MMKFDWLTSLRVRRVLGICFFSLTVLSACAKSTVPVSLHGVNYGAETFSYVIVDPENPKNTGGGGLIEPYAAGGTMCCIDLPRKWHAGIKLTIESTHWQETLKDESLHEVNATDSVEVPQYADGKPGELWVLRAADGAISLVSSDFQPDHPKWPGKVKGWPVPSLAYQREQWDKYIDHEKGWVKLHEDLLGQLAATPELRAKEAWAFKLEHDRMSLAGYRGPEDAKFRDSLFRDYEEGLKRSKHQLQELERGRP